MQFSVFCYNFVPCMEKADLTDKQYSSLLDSIVPIILEKGPSHTSMDLVASRLSMSKRTLYEIFGSKDEMMLEVFEYLHGLHKQQIDRIFTSTQNAMEGMAKVADYHQQVFNLTNAAFFRDMDERSKHLREDYDGKYRKLNDELSKVFMLGIRQGVFRKDIDYSLQMLLLRVQMESLKRMEENFPPEITLAKAYHTIAQSFLRSIATTKGLEVLERLESDNNDLQADNKEQK